MYPRKYEHLPEVMFDTNNVFFFPKYTALVSIAVSYVHTQRSNPLLQIFSPTPVATYFIYFDYNQI